MDSYTLVDMRVHDINVVTDLDQHDPNSATPPPTQDPPAGGEPEPVVYDGTKGTPKLGSTFMVEDFFESNSQDVQAYWTGWWPVLHIRFSFYPIPEINLILHFTIDILGSFSIDPETVLNILNPVLMTYGVKNAQNVDNVYQMVMRDIVDYLFGMGGVAWRVAWAAALTLKLTSLVMDTGPWGAALFAANTLIYVGALIAGAAQVVQDALDGILHPLVAAFILILNALAIAVDGLNKLYSSAKGDTELNRLQEAGNLLTETEIENKHRGVCFRYAAGLVLMITACGLVTAGVGLLVWFLAQGIDITYDTVAT